MAKFNILPVVAAAAGVYLFMKRDQEASDVGTNGGTGKPTVFTHILGGARKILHDLYHGDLLLQPHDFRPKLIGDTLKIQGAGPNWAYSTGSSQFDGDAQAGMVEVFHDRDNNVVYATLLVDPSTFNLAGTSGSVDVLGTAPGQEPQLLAAVRA